MGPRAKCLMTLGGVAIVVATIILGLDHRLWLFALGALLMSPLWVALWGDIGQRSSDRCLSPPAESPDVDFSSFSTRFFDDDSFSGLFADNSYEQWRSPDPNHISNGGTNLIEFESSYR